jgi:hypothetical protein
MTPQGLLDRLDELFPDFRAHWADPKNCFRDDDFAFTLHGVFAEFSDFFRDRYQSLSVDRVADLGAFVSECVGSPDAELNNAAATCFVENIAGEDCAREVARHFTGDALKYFRSWGGHT